MKIKRTLLSALSIVFLASGIPAAEDDIKNMQEEYGKLVSHYYLHPKPEKIPSSLLFVSEHGGKNSLLPAAAFYAELFRNDSGLMNETYDSVNLWGNKVSKDMFIKACWLANTAESKKLLEDITKAWPQGNIPEVVSKLLGREPPDLIKGRIVNPAQLDMLWASFNATGDEAPVKKIISAINLSKEGKGKEILFGGAALWSLKSNAKQHKKVYDICQSVFEGQEEGVTRDLLADILIEGRPGQEDQKKLEEKVKELLKGSNVTLRRNIDDVYRLGDIYFEEGDYEDAAKLYEAALRVDSWNLGYQFKYAQVLAKTGQSDAAVKRARIVYKHAKDDKLIGKAENLLAELGDKQSIEDPKREIDESVEIVLVPIGDVSKKLLYELKYELQKVMGIKISTAGGISTPGQVDRSEVHKYLDYLVTNIRAKLTPDDMDNIMSKYGVKGYNLDSVQGKMRFIEIYLREIGAPESELNKFRDTSEQLKSKGQYDADRLRTLVVKRYPVGETSEIKGYLGITEEDIYARDYNFLFGWACPGYGVMSYHRFTPEFNNEKPDRRKLLARALKQAVSSSFFILGIPRCSHPTCMRAYPHNLQEHDMKGKALCDSCKQKLDAYLGGLGKQPNSLDKNK